MTTATHSPPIIHDDVQSYFYGRSTGWTVTLASSHAHYGEGSSYQEAYIRAHAHRNEADRRSPEAAAREIASWTPLASAIAEVAK